MTAQINDTINYRGQNFSIVSIEHEPLFEPQHYGLTPYPISTACWRGFYCSYTLNNQHLTLGKLSIGFNETDSALIRAGGGVSLDGTHPTYDAREFCFLYDRLSLHVSYTGGLLVGLGFIHDLYVHMGFHPAWKYAAVYELIFEAGMLIEESDRSKEMAGLRERLQQQSLSPGSHASEEAIHAWIEQTFNRSYQR